MNYIKKLVNYTRTFLIFAIVSTALLTSVTSAFADEDDAEFLKAAFSGKPETIKQLLAKGINVKMTRGLMR